MEFVTFNIEDGIAVLSINRPNFLNALNGDTAKEIDKCVKEIKGNNSIKVLIIYSKKNFAAGADISEMVKCDSIRASEYVYSSAFNNIKNLNIPTISAIEGYALGGGMELALTADIRFAAKSAKMGFPEVSLGLFPGAGGSIWLPQLIGPSRAKEMIFSAEIIDSQRALAIGLVNRVVDDGMVYSEAVRFAKLMLSRSQTAIKTAKGSIEYAIKEPNYDNAVKYEREAWVGLFDTQDKEEGMTAFLEKRKPNFNK